MKYKIELSGTHIGMWEIYHKKWWQFRWKSTGELFSNAGVALLEIGYRVNNETR